MPLIRGIIKDINNIMANIITCGTFDLFHIGHVNVINRCASIDRSRPLVIGVSSDFLNIEKKNRLPIMSIYDRYMTVQSNQNVTEVFIEEEYSTESKIKYMHIYGGRIFAIGDDWKGRFDELVEYGYLVDYIPRTPAISTSEILERISYNNSIDYKKSMLPLPSKKIASVEKFSNIRCVFFPRNQAHHVVHLLPYYYLFNEDNLAWFLDKNENGTPVNYDMVIKNMEKFAGIRIKNVIKSYAELDRFKPDIGIITENWTPHCRAMRSIGGKMLFVDHGICAGTRPRSWFAMRSLDYVDKILVAGEMQKQYHAKCAKSGDPLCHTKSQSDIVTIGWPRISLQNDGIDWIWNLYGSAYKKKILYCPTSYYDEMSNPKKRSAVINLIRMLCSNNYKVIIRPHPTDQMNNGGVLHEIFMTSIAEYFSHNLVIIPPKSSIYTPLLFSGSDLVILDKSSVGYECLLHDKPAIVLGGYNWDVPSAPFLKDAYPHYDVLDITMDVIDRNIENTETLKQQREFVRKCVFAYDDESWIENFSNIIAKVIAE
jgi:cytidyltransferase-like protein